MKHLNEMVGYIEKLVPNVAELNIKVVGRGKSFVQYSCELEKIVIDFVFRTDHIESWYNIHVRGTRIRFHGNLSELSKKDQITA